MLSLSIWMWLELHIESVLNGHSAGVCFLKEKDINIWLSKKNV